MQSTGLTVTHTITSDETDEVNELWASLPVYLRHNNPLREGEDHQRGMEDTSIEYWDGSQWRALPDSESGTPSMVTTDVIRLGRGYLLGDGMQYAYVSFTGSQRVRRSEGKYYDPYQSKTGVRTVHIDLHGNPGTTKTLPAETSVSYTIQTIEPPLDDPSTGQSVLLEKGDNLVSTSIVPEPAHMDSVFADVASDIVEVQNEKGDRYRPGDGVNEIGNWDPSEAYVVHAKTGTTLSLQGTSLDTSSVTLEEGWNWVPYTRSATLPVEEALASIDDVLVIVKDETGRAYVPDEGIQELEILAPGEGYKIYVSSSIMLTYP